MDLFILDRKSERLLYKADWLTGIFISAEFLRNIPATFRRIEEGRKKAGNRKLGVRIVAYPTFPLDRRNPCRRILKRLRKDGEKLRNFKGLMFDLYSR